VADTNGSDPHADEVELLEALLDFREARADSRAALAELRAAGWRTYRNEGNGSGWLAVSETGKQIRRASLGELAEAVSGSYKPVHNP
jgi:hypothetical protein